MKPFLVTLLVLCAAATGGAIYYLDHTKDAVRLPEIDPARAQTTVSANDFPPLPPPQPAMAPPVKSEAPAPESVAVAVSSKPAPVVTNPIAQLTDTLLAADTSFSQKHALLRHLHDSGELDQVIAELKQRAAAEPASADIRAALGEAYLNKFPVDDFNEAAILGMQADQSFAAALKIDPSNWEAQYYKADAMSYWPVSMNKGPEVIQNLSSLIDQQEAAPVQQPQYAQTYALLGDQYLKAGQPDYAQQTWKLGAARFPNDATLQMKLGGPGK